MCTCCRTVPQGDRHPAGEGLVPGTRAARSTGQSASELPETAQVLRAQRSQASATQASEETVSCSPNYIPLSHQNIFQTYISFINATFTEIILF